MTKPRRRKPRRPRRNHTERQPAPPLRATYWHGRLVAITGPWLDAPPEAPPGSLLTVWLCPLAMDAYQRGELTLN